jgi:hypothetical protein
MILVQCCESSIQGNDFGAVLWSSVFGKDYGAVL